MRFDGLAEAVQGGRRLMNLLPEEAVANRYCRCVGRR